MAEGNKAAQNGTKNKNKKAETAEEFKAKYGRKRFTSDTAGKAHIYAYIYWAYLKNEGLSNEELIAQPLYKNLDAISEKIKTLKGLHVYNAYIGLEDWIGQTLEAALFMSNSVKSVLAHIYSIASGAIAGEELKNTLGAQASDDNIWIWLHLLSVDSIRPTTGSYQTVLTLRKNVETGLTYLNAYNTFIGILADELEIPELTVFQLNLEPIANTTAQLNEALSALRDSIKQREVVADRQEPKTLPIPFTPKEMEATLEAFRDISLDVPPIPERSIMYTKRNVSFSVIHGTRSWSSLFNMFFKNSWRQ